MCHPLSLQLTVVYVLQGATTTVLHANPELVPPKIAAIVCHYVAMATVLHHQDFLLDDAEIIPCMVRSRQIRNILE